MHLLGPGVLINPGVKTLEGRNATVGQVFPPKESL